MPTAVRSYCKINLGLAIGATRPDGFHSLLTLYQTLALHDRVTVAARPANKSLLRITSNDPRVPTEGRNTAWKIVEATLERRKLSAEVVVHIQKTLPLQGGLGAGSANAAAALLGLERELGLELTREERLAVAEDVGSDVPLFFIGGTILGTGRGEIVQGLEDVTIGGASGIACVIALPGVGVSTPAAFRQWDEINRIAHSGTTAAFLHKSSEGDTMEKLSRTYSAVLHSEDRSGESGTSGIFYKLGRPSSRTHLANAMLDSPENLHGHSREQLHTFPENGQESGFVNDLAEDSLLELVRTGIENDFEQVVFLEYPFLREIKRQLMGFTADGNSAIHAALSGSGSALFGLYRSGADAEAAQQRLLQSGVRAIVTSTMSRSDYWADMFAE